MATAHDVTQLLPLVEAIPAIRGVVGRPRGNGQATRMMKSSAPASIALTRTGKDAAKGEGNSSAMCHFRTLRGLFHGESLGPRDLLAHADESLPGTGLARPRKRSSHPHTISPRKKRDAETPQTPKRRITTILATLMPSAGCVGLGCRVLAERRQELRCCAGPSMNGAAQESNLPSVGLPRRTGFEVLQGEYKVRGLQPATAEHCPRNRWKRQQRASARLSRKFSPR